jgi:hypothetical protein
LADLQLQAGLNAGEQSKADHLARTGRRTDIGKEHPFIPSAAPLAVRGAWYIAYLEQAQTHLQRGGTLLMNYQRLCADQTIVKRRRNRATRRKQPPRGQLLHTGAASDRASARGSQDAANG